MSDAPWLMCSHCERESGISKGSGATYRLLSQGFYEPVFTFSDHKERGIFSRGRSPVVIWSRGGSFEGVHWRKAG